MPWEQDRSLTKNVLSSSSFLQIQSLYADFYIPHVNSKSLQKISLYTNYAGKCGIFESWYYDAVCTSVNNYLC